jgi:integrase
MRAALKNIVFRGTQAIYRRRIPKTLQAQFAGQTEVFIGLPAASRQDLHRWSTLLSARFETAKVFAQAGVHQGRFDQQMLRAVQAAIQTPLHDGQSGQSNPSDGLQPKWLRQEDIDLLANRYRSLHLATDEALRFGNPADENRSNMSRDEHREYKELLIETVEQLQEAQACGDTAIVRETATEFLDSEGFVAQVADSIYRQFEQRLLATDVEVAQLQLRRSQGDSVTTPAIPEIDDHALMFKTLVEQWAKGRGVHNKTAIEGRAAVRLFSEWCSCTHGRVLSANRVTVENAAQFRDWLLEYVPPRYRATGKTLHPASAKKYLGLLGAMVSHYATDRTITFANAFVAVTKPKKARGEGKPRIAFTQDQLKQLFHHPSVRQLQNSTHEFEQTMHWTLLVGLYTGARLEEIGQLLVRDIESFAENTFFHFCDDAAGQSIKTSNRGSAGSRYVPIHATLVQFGFLDYVARQKRRCGSEGRLFPALKADSHGVLTGYLSKRIGVLLDTVGLSDPRLTFHSFRHTFKHFSRLCCIPKAVLDQLVGHESGEVGDAYGGEDYPIEPLIDGVKRYQLPFLDFAAENQPKALRME